MLQEADGTGPWPGRWTRPVSWAGTRRGKTMTFWLGLLSPQLALCLSVRAQPSMAGLTLPHRFKETSRNAPTTRLLEVLGAVPPPTPLQMTVPCGTTPSFGITTIPSRM